jgi:hypothetical protein
MTRLIEVVESREMRVRAMEQDGKRLGQVSVDREPPEGRCSVHAGERLLRQAAADLGPPGRPPPMV